jgi:hypothetical protein
VSKLLNYSAAGTDRGRSKGHPPSLTKCVRCPFKGPPSDFPQNASLKILKTCAECLEKKKKKAAVKRAEKENQDGGHVPMVKTVHNKSDHPPTLDWGAFVLLLKDCHSNACELNAFVTDSGCLPLVVTN